MSKLFARIPDKETLEYGLSSVFRLNGYGSSVVRILDRQANVYTSTCPSEIVTCKFDDGRKLRLLCKYAVESGYITFGHRGGVAYEVEVYRHVLQPLQVSTPAFHGAHIDKTTGQTWLILNYLNKSIRVNKEPATMELTARWIGQFHAANEALLSKTPMTFLNTYDADYYLGWACRTSQLAGHWHQHFPWLDALCESFEGLVDSLLAPKPTIIHGEYTPENILIRNGIIYPVDWESAAIAVGEIDLAMLTDGWCPETVQQCELEYKRARWPVVVPANFERTLDTARLYVQYRWLGNQPGKIISKDMLWRFEQLQSVGKRLGIKE